MAIVGLRELRQDASELDRRAQSGEEITITVSGRPSARLVATGPTRWCSWDQISDLFRGTEDEAWSRDRDLLDDSASDPWAER